MTTKQHLHHVIGNIVRAGGRVTTPEHADARMQICIKCPKYGTVNPLPGIEAPGCTICRCIGEEKVRTLTFRSSIRRFKKETCPHPEGSKWADVDNQFEKLYQTS